MEAFPLLETNRLVLDQIKLGDVPKIVAYAGNKKVTDNTRTMPHPYFEEDAISLIHMTNEGFKNKNKYIFALRDRSNLAFMGGIGLTVDTENNRAEIGYWIAEKFWNKGYTTEAVKEVLKFGFEELQLNKIVAVYVDSNIASGKLMEKNGMVQEGELKNHDIKFGKYITLIQYRMLKSEYQALE